jgi:hypothetical protein
MVSVSGAWCQCAAAISNAVQRFTFVTKNGATSKQGIIDEILGQQKMGLTL